LTQTWNTANKIGTIYINNKLQQKQSLPVKKVEQVNAPLTYQQERKTEEKLMNVIETTIVINICSVTLQYDQNSL